MKKILLILLPFLLVGNVQADTYYSNYSNYSSFSLDKVLESDTVSVVKERRYRLSKEEKIEGDYYIEGFNPELLPFKDSNNFKYTYTDWGDYNANFYPSRETFTRTVYSYQNMKKIRYIHFYNMSGSNNAYRIPELNILVKDQKIDYDFTCTGCYLDFEKYINNDVIYENKSIIENGGYLKLDLKEYYDINDITIKLYLFDTTNLSKICWIGMSAEPTLDKLYMKVGAGTYFTYKDLSEIKPFIYTVNSMSRANPEWERPLKSLNKIESSKTTLVNTYQEYQYKDKLFYYYGYKPILSPTYSKEPTSEYPILVKDDYLDYYAYKKREKIVINDNLLITDKDQKLNDFVLESTTPVDIKSNVDLNKNGIYQIKFTTPYKEIVKNVKVFIKENSQKEKINSLLEQIKYLKNENIRLNQIISNSKKQVNKDTKIVISDNEVILERLKTKEEELQKCQSTIKQLDTNQDVIVMNEKGNKENGSSKLNKTNYGMINSNYKTIIFLSIIILFILIIQIIRKKLSHQKSN